MRKSKHIHGFFVFQQHLKFYFWIKEKKEDLSVCCFLEKKIHFSVSQTTQIFPKKKMIEHNSLSEM